MSTEALAVTAVPNMDVTGLSLALGERYAGVVLNADGSLKHHLIKLPGMSEKKVTHKGARDYAQACGGVTPTRQEGRLLQANLRDELPREAIWLDDECEGDTACAWCQSFGDGSQSTSHKSAALRAVAVRRFIPSVI